jgi:hypothetical protein
MPATRRLNVAAAAQRAKADPSARPMPARPAPSKPAARKPVVGPVRRSTTVSLRTAGESDPTHEAMVNETIGTRTVADPARLAHVRFGAGLTINLGNFESARIDVQVEMPCDMDDIAPALEETAEFVHARPAEEEARWASK